MQSKHHTGELSDILCACGCGEFVPKAKYPSQQNRYIKHHQHRGEHNGHYKGGKTKHCCPVCLKSFFAYEGRGRVTCGDDACYRKWQGMQSTGRSNIKVSVTCAYCGKEFMRFPSMLVGRKRHYCSRKCHNGGHGVDLNGDKHPLWKGGRDHYTRNTAKKRDGNRCAICGFDLIIQVHHITPKSEGGTNDPNNVITLCPNHHKMADRNILKREYLFEIIAPASR
jgi:hypothetical protein